MIFATSKTDIIRLEDLREDRKALYDDIVNDPDILMLEMSTVTEEGVMRVKQEVNFLCLQHKQLTHKKLIHLYNNIDCIYQACDRLMSFRVESKMRSKKASEFVDRLHVAIPKPRDDKHRLPYIPGNS